MLESGVAVVNTAKKIWELVQEAKGLADKAGSIELQKFLLQLQQEALDLQAENLALKEKIQKQDKLLNIEKELRFEKGVYWKNTDGPFCQKCQDADCKLIRLQDWDDCWHCHQCNNSYYTKDNSNNAGSIQSEYDPMDFQ